MKGEMERKKKLIVFFSIFAGVYLAFILCSLICRYGLHLEYPYGSFLFFREDAFKDFSTINGAVKDRNPYLSGLSNYPPFILFIAFSLPGQATRRSITNLWATLSTTLR